MQMNNGKTKIMKYQVRKGQAKMGFMKGVVHLR